MTKTKTVKCLKCGKEWTPRSAHPRRCPGCLSTNWDKMPEASPEPVKEPDPVMDHPFTIIANEVRKKREPRPPRMPKDKRFSEAHQNAYEVFGTIMPKAPLLALLVILMYDALTSMAKGDMWFVMDWYQATWILPRIVGIFLYPGGPGEWFKLYWPLFVLLVMLAISLWFVIWALPYRFAFKDYVIIRGNVKVKDARVMWSSDNLWTRLWDRLYNSPPRDKVELWLKHKLLWNPLLPDKGLVKLTLDRAIEKPEQDGPFVLTAYERRYRKFVALNEMVTTDDGQQSREIPLDQANDRFNERGKLLVWDTQRFSLANPDVRIEKLKRGTHIVPQELQEAADVARKARQEN